MAQTRLAYSTVDDYLGPGTTRFFGSGYRRADYRIRDVRAGTAVDAGRRADAPGAGSAVDATVTVRYPHDWSKKSGGLDLRPHLSTIDILVLTVQLSEVHLAHTFGLSAGERRAARLRRVTLRCGMSPQEDLDDLPASSTLRNTWGSPDAANRSISAFDCAIGEMRARCEIEHQTAVRAEAGGYFRSIDDALGRAADRYYGDAFKRRQLLIDEVRADLGSLRAEATVRAQPAAGDPDATQGVEGAYQPSVSMVDCFVVSLQLAQVLMYEMDGVPRRDSSTLWMLYTSMETVQEERPFDRPIQARTVVARRRLLPVRGGTWRNVDVVGELGGISLRSSIAHELPASAARGTR